MYVCVCKAVTDGDIQRSVEQGAWRVADLSREYELGRSCGRCVDTARAVLDGALAAAFARVGRAA